MPFIGADELVRRMEAGAQDALAEIGDKLVADAKEQAPLLDPAQAHESGHSPDTLRKSIQRDDVGHSAEVDGFEVTVYTGAEASDYAAVQHEHLDYKHAQGKARFLEDPLLEHVPDYEVDFARNVGEHFNG